MTDILHVLYRYAQTQADAWLALMPEYPSCCRWAGEKERELREHLSPGDMALLEDLLR